MAYTIQKPVSGDEAILAYIQTESWKAGFKDILSADILNQYTQIDPTTEMYRHLLTQNIGHGYLMKVDNQPHGIAWWSAAREPNMPGCAELICIHSLPDRWHNGYGSQLIKTVLQDIQSAGYSKVILWVFEENIRARRFYESHGFSNTGKQKESFSSTEVCYEKVF